MTVRILAQRGSTTVMVAAGEHEFNGKVQPLGRVYDVLRDQLFPPFPIVSLTARGYWTKPELPPAAKDRIVRAVEAKLAEEDA